MFTAQDLELINKKGIELSAVESQLERFKTGFPYLKVVAPATIDNGVIKLSGGEETECIYEWEDYIHSASGDVEKFVPASGAASRMFKNLFEFLSSGRKLPETAFEKDFFNGIANFAFYDELNDVCRNKTGKTIEELIEANLYTEIVNLLLGADGLNYGAKPKGVLTFHKTGCCTHTPLEEHLEEGAQYAVGKRNIVKVHFTVSPEHKSLFKDIIEAKVPALENKFGVKFVISMSEQKSSTDTIAVNLDNTPFRNADGSLLFRPAGHGALIENLNEIESKVIFIKNIDNVVPTDKREMSTKYKMVIGGYLILLQKKIAKYVSLLETGAYTIEDLREMIHFIHDKLNTRYSETKHLDDSELALYLLKKFNRPIRVCGVVRNDGEPGGGPYIAYNADGTTSPQILESSQFDKNDAASMEMMKNATHFNPVDLVCYVYDKSGSKFNLTKYVDHETGFISEKSKDGKALRALELPGLWNGSMSDWNTAFIEVPIETFNPVKTVNDLLRPMHQ